MLVLLIVTYLQARKEKKSTEYVTEYMNFSIYLGWISVASIANVSIWLTQIGVDYEGVLASILTIVVIAVAVVLGLVFVFKQNNPWYALVILWASYGIYMARSVDVSNGAESVKIGALIAVIILAIGIVYKRLAIR